MYITRVLARGFKRGNFDATLSRATVITGDNFAGKSQILDAVRLGLIGYLPELGKQPGSTFGLASASQMSVELHFDTGAVLRREYWLEGNSVKSKHTVPAVLKDCPALAVMLNSEEYFALGPLDRTRYVFANCPIPELPINSIAADVKKAAPDYDFSQALAALQQEKEDLSASDHPPLNPQQELDIILKFVADHWTALQRDVQTQQGTINGIMGQRADEESSTPLSALEDRRAVLAREIAEATDRRGRLLSSFTQMTADRRRREEINRELGFGDKARQQITDAKNRLALLREKAPAAVTTDEFTVSLQKCAGYEAKGQQAKRDQAAAQALRIKEEKAFAALDAATSCPCCGAAGEGWKTAKAAEHAQAIEQLKHAEGQHQQAANDAVFALTEAQAAHKVLVERSNARTLHEMQIRETEAQLAKLEPQVARHAALAEELIRLMPDNPELTATVEAIQTELNVKNEEARRLDKEITIAAGRANDLKRMATAEKARDDATKQKEQAALAGKCLKAIQAEIVAGVFGPLLKTANSLFAGVLPFALEYKDGEIGARADGLWRGHRTMSGVERLLTYCAIQMALAERSPVRVAILDEMGRMVSKRIPAFGTAISAAIRDGVIDQALLVDPERGHEYDVLPDVADHDKKAFTVLTVQ